MNFSFLNPLFLIGLTAVLLPVIAHLISRKSGIKKHFPAVRFLITSSGDTAARSRLKDLILLVLRSLIIVLVVLVFAKPAVFSFAPPGNENPRSVAIVIDNSFSMGYGGNFNRARSRAKDIIDTLPDGSFGLVAPLVPRNDGRLVPSGDRRELIGMVNGIPLSSTFTDNEKRLEEALSAIEKTPNKIKEAVLITDLQKNGWEKETLKSDRVRIIDISEEEEPPNRAVSDIATASDKSSYKLSVKVSNFSEKAAEDILAGIRLGGEDMKGFYDIAPGVSEVREFLIPKDRFPDRENPEGYVGITHDELKIDDTRYFILSESDESKILIVDGDPREDARLSESYYLARAAETISEFSGEAVSIRDNDSFLKEDLSDYDLIFLANVGEITPRNTEALEEFVRQGGTLVIFLGERTRSSSYNTLLKNILPGELLKINEGEFSITPEGSDMFSGDIREKINQVEVKRYFDLLPAPEADVVFSTSGGAPFLVGKEIGRGSVFLFTSTADTGWNNFPLTPVFLPVTKEFLDLPGYSNTKRRNYTVGDRVPIDVLTDSGNMEVIDPAGEKTGIDPGNPLFEKTYTPGIYTVTGDGDTVYKFSVNIDPRESNLEKITINETVPDDTGEGGFVKVFREIWRYFLFGALALFISESIARAVFP